MNKLKKVEGVMIEVKDKKHDTVECSAVDFYDEIQQLEDVQPKDKRSIEYKKWKRNINEKIEEANDSLGRKMFNIIR